MGDSRSSLPTLSSDLILLHPPAIYDFRGRDDIYFPFLGTSGDVPITPNYEYFPLGFKTLQRYLRERGHDVLIINLGTLLLRYPTLPLDVVLRALDAPLIGLDLHWMVHVQGGLAVAQEIRRTRPDLRTIFGGISATYYADQLIRYPQVDYVMKGYDTHEPMHQLLQGLKSGRDLSTVPNLLSKERDGTVRENPSIHLPADFACGIDWTSTTPEADGVQLLPIKEILSTQNAGCAYNCGWCGGSRDAFRRIFNRKPSMARKPAAEVDLELMSLSRLARPEMHHLYAVGSYNETRQGMQSFMNLVEASGVGSVSYEQFHLTPESILRRMVQANRRTTITLSPESHDPRVARLSGRGVYTNDELESWVWRALDIGIHEIDIWYFVGMPEQDADSVRATVDYCRRLLKLFTGHRVNPMICPMIPFLDPASTFFENPEQHGYRVYHRTVEEHRRGMENASIINRINYETKWLSRTDLVNVGFRAVQDLMSAKAEWDFLPASWVEDFNAAVDDALEFIPVVHAADCIPSRSGRSHALAEVGTEILRRNNQVLYGGVRNQAFPVGRKVGGRWFDELGWSIKVLDQITADGN